MKYISYILMVISVMLAILALVLLLKKEAVLRDKLLDTLQNARDIKHDKKVETDNKEILKKETDDSTKEKTK